MLILIVLIVVAIATGVLGAVIKGAFWLFILTALCLIAAALVGRSTAKR